MMKQMGNYYKRTMAVLLSLSMVLTMLPTTISFAASIPTVYAAAYQDAAALTDTTLPSSVEVDGQQVPVTWTWEDNAFMVPYDTVDVAGTTKSGDALKAQVEVLPQKANQLIYFVDASREGTKESKAFNSVKELSATTLKNSVSDQVYNTTDQWGRTGDNFREKGTSNIDVTKKIESGWYSSSKTTALTYQYYLEAGTYTLTAGFCEWWNGRSMKLSLSGVGMTSVTSGTATVSGVGSTAVESLTFTVDSACTVKMEVQNATGGEAPVISWFAVAKGSVVIPEKPIVQNVVIDGSDVAAAAANKNGLTYKGFGLLSGNSTSDLLMDYKQESPEVYNKMLQVLFGGSHPLMDHIKMEMGNDGNNSTSADSCTMRFEDEDADASRSPGFQLAADAKKINPNVKVSFLRWSMPAWVNTAWNNDRTGAGYEAMYKWYRETIFDAYEKYGYIVDYVNPDTNETQNPDEDFIKWFKNKLVTESSFPSYMDTAAINAYHTIKIIASDENNTLNIVPSLRADSALYDAVDAVGFHYRAGDATSTADYRTLADVDDKEVWYSEGCATFSYSEYQENKTDAYGADTIGGYQSPLAMADNFIKSFVYSRKTHYIFQPAIGSFYEGSQYDHKELLSAREPWAGYVHYDPAIYMLEHFTKFAVTGWENADNTAGIWRVIPNASGNNSSGSDHLKNESGNPSYMTLAAPDKSNFSVVMVNNSDKQLEYHIKASKLNITDGAPVEIWETKTDSYLKYKKEAAYKDGYYTVIVAPYSMVTATTLDCNNKEEYNERLPQEGEKAVLDTDAAGKELDNTNSILYADDFSYAGYASDYLASRGNEPRYLVDYSGAFVVKDGKLEQLLPTSVGEWNHNDPNAVIGDFRWMNYKASIDVTVPGTGYAAIAIREQTGMGLEGSGYNLRITKDGMWTLKKRGSTLVSGVVKADSNGSYQLSLEGKGGIITAWVDGKQVAEYLDTNPEYFGRVRIASSWDKTTFDNLSVEKIAGYLPYATQMIDNASDEVTYQGGWNIIAGAGGSNNDWYRSTSTNTNTGDSLQFTLKGDGFALIGANNGSAKLNITVDGEQKALNAVTNSSSQHCATYMMTGLEDKQHQVVVTVVEGTLVLDAIYFLPYSKTNKDKLNALLENANALEKGDYTDATWSTFTTARSDAQAVLEKIDATQQEVDTSQVALALAMQGLLKGSSVVLAEEVQTAMYAGGAWNLPATLNCETADGNKVVKNVIWNTANLSPKAYDTITVFGTISDDNYVAKATVEVVPKDLIYFVDAGTGIGYYNNNTTAAQSKPYDLVHGLVTDLKNTSSDVAYSDANGWGYINDGTTNKVSATVDGGDRPNTYTSTDKYNVGLRDKTNRAQPMRYRFTLDAGKYELTVGCHEFYGSGRVRDMQPGVVWKDAKGNDKEVKGTVINLRSQNNTGTVSFSLDTTAVVEFQLSYVSGEASMYSWLGVAKTGEYDPNEIVTITAPDMCAVASGQAIELPQTVEVTTVEGVTKTVAVTWDTEGVDLVTPYKTVSIKGSVEGSSLTTEVKVEVIPSTIVWFIDSGIDLETQTTTAPFQAVKNRIPSIKNDKADQAFAGGVTWGYNADAVKIKGQSDIDMSNKAESGLYGQGSGETSSPIIYTLPMEAGNYNINLGFHEWWGMTRTMKVSASWIDALGDAKEVVLADKVTLSPSHLEEQVSDAIALDAGTVVTIKIERAEGTEAPVVSWLAVDKVLPVDKSDLAKAVSGAAILVETNYTKESFANVSEALKEAYGVLADENATKEAVITALNALQNAVANLEIRIEAPKAQITTDPVDTSALANEKVVLVTLLAPAPSEAIYYTLDGSTSSITSNRYTAPFEVKTSNVKGETISVKAVSVYEDQISKSVEKTIVFLPRDNGGAGSVISIPLPTPSSDRTVYQEGDTITYAKDAFEKAAKEKQDLHVVVKDKSGKEVYSWKFEGKDLAAAKDEQKDVDLTLKIVPTKESDELKEVLSKEEGVVLNFGYDGMLPSQATVRVNVKDSLDASNVGKRVYVYHYNQETKKLENLPFSSTYKMDEEGYVSINLVHCSDYVILAKKPGRSMIATLGEQIQATNGKKTLSIGKSKQIEVTLPQTLEQVKYLKDATTSSALGGAKVRYHSLDKAIAIVDANGKIVAKKKGKTTILTKVTLYNKKVIVFKTTITVK